VVAGGLVGLGVELVPQPPKTQSRATAATAADADRRAQWSRIWVFSPNIANVSHQLRERTISYRSQLVTST
jgi:flagellar basal body rod protein FlgC